MRYKTHIAGGLALGYFTINNIEMLNINLSDNKTLLIATAGLVLGSLVSDIDIASSYLSNKLKIISFFTSKLFKHREFTHSIVGAGSMSMLMYFILKKLDIHPRVVNDFSISFSIGIVTHILLDLMTCGGVVLFFPFYKKRIKTSAKFCINNTYRNFIESAMIILFVFIAYRSLII